MTDATSTGMWSAREGPRRHPTFRRHAGDPPMSGRRGRRPAPGTHPAHPRRRRLTRSLSPTRVTTVTHPRPRIALTPDLRPTHNAGDGDRRLLDRAQVRADLPLPHPRGTRMRRYAELPVLAKPPGSLRRSLPLPLSVAIQGRSVSLLFLSSLLRLRAAILVHDLSRLVPETGHPARPIGGEGGSGGALLLACFPYENAGTTSENQQPRLHTDDLSADFFLIIVLML